MTVTTTISRMEYTGNGVTTTFAYSFKINTDSELKVWLVTTATGAKTLQTLTTHYTVTNAGDVSGGNVEMITAPASTEELVIERSTSTTQAVDYVANDAFAAETHEGALDKLTLIAQDLRRDVDRSMQLDKETADAVSTIMPVPEANAFVGWNASADALVNFTTTLTGTAVTPFIATLVDDTSAAAARATLEALAEDLDQDRHATSSGTNTITLTLDPARTAYTAGDIVTFKAGGTNTGAVTLNVNSLGAKTVQFRGAALAAGDITANNFVVCGYDGTQFQMLSPVVKPTRASLGLDTTDDPTFSDVTADSLTLAAVNAITSTNANFTKLAKQRWLEDFFEARYFDLQAHNPKVINGTLSWWPKHGNLDWIASQNAGDIDLLAVDWRDGTTLKTYTSSDFSQLGGKTLTSIAAGHAVVVVGTTAGYVFLDFRNGAPTQRLRDTGSGLVDNDIHALAVGVGGPDNPVVGNGLVPVIGGQYGAGTDVAFIENHRGVHNQNNGGNGGAMYAVGFTGGYFNYVTSPTTNQVVQTSDFASDISADDWGNAGLAVNNSWPRFFGGETFAASNGRDTLLFGSAEGISLVHNPARDIPNSSVGFDMDSSRCIARAGNHKSSWFVDSITADRGPDGTTLTHTGGGLTIASANGTSTKQMVSGFDASNYAEVSSNVFNNASDPFGFAVDFRSDGTLNASNNYILNWHDTSANTSRVYALCGTGGMAVGVYDSGGSTTGIELTFGPTVAELNDEPDRVHTLAVLVRPGKGVFCWLDGEFMGFDGNSLFVNSMAPSGTNTFRVGAAVVNASYGSPSEQPFGGSIGEITHFEDAIVSNPDAHAWWAAHRIRSYDEDVVCVLPANETPDAGDLDKTAAGLARGIVCGATKTFLLDGLAVTEVAPTGINAHVDQVYRSRNEYGMLDSVGAHYQNRDAIDIEETSRAMVSAPRWLEPAGKVGIDAYMAASKSNVTGDATNYTVPIDTVKKQTGLVLDTATGVIHVLVSGYYDVKGHLDMENWDASTTRAASWVYLNTSTLLFAVWDKTWNFAGSERISAGSSERRWLNAGDTIELKAYAAGGAKVADVTSGGSTSYQTSLLAHLVG